MPAYRRVFSSFPGYDTLGKIESINVVDQTPQSVPLGDGVLIGCVVGEFEDGPYNAPTRVFSAQDRLNTFGRFGFTRDGVQYQYPVARKSAGSTAPWEGNAYIHLARKNWNGLVLVRVDGSSGSVTFTRVASLVGNKGPFSLTSGNTVVFSVNGAAGVTGTFTGVRATKAGSGGTFNTGFLGGETLELVVDGVPRVVVFTAAAQTAAQVVAEINSQTASDIAIVNTGQVDLRSIVAGTSGTIQVTGGTGRATIGQAIASASGTGNVGNIAAVTQAEAISIITALTGIDADSDPDGKIRAKAVTTPGTGTIQVTSMSATALGFPVASTVSAAVGVGTVTIPAGTLLKDETTLAYWLTCESVVITDGAATAVKVRPANDDDTCPTAAVDDIVIIVDSLPDGFVVTNSAQIQRLTNSQMDARYQTAIAATIDSNGVSRDIDVICAARSTATIGLALKENVIAATASGHRPRKFVFSPVVGTTRVNAKANTGIGVGNIGRTERCNYLFPGGTVQIPEIAAIGSSGGTGFTEDGVIQMRADIFYAAARTNLPPEESAAQDLSTTPSGALPFLSMENAYNPVYGGTGLTEADYTDFKAKGIIAIRFESGSVGFQSDVSSIDPSISSSDAVPARHRWFADYIARLLQNASSPYQSKLSKLSIRRSWISQINLLLNTLKSPNQPETSRIKNYDVKDITPEEMRDKGHGILSVEIETYSSLDYMTIMLSVGDSISITEEAAA